MGASSLIRLRGAQELAPMGRFYGKPNQAPLRHDRMLLLGATAAHQ